MKQLQGLEQRLRGWFPQEPTLPKHLKMKLESHKRDWFPKDPLITAIRTTNDEKFNRWALCPFLTPGALMILSAILSTPFVLLLVFAYLQFVIVGSSVSMYSALYPVILSIGAFILESLSGILLLANRSINKAAACIVAVFSFGIAILMLPPLLDGRGWGSFYGVISSPIIVLSAVSLILVGLDYRKLKNSLITKEDNITGEVIPELQA
jgi:hypothetical protein